MFTAPGERIALSIVDLLRSRYAGRAPSVGAASPDLAGAIFVPLALSQNCFWNSGLWNSVMAARPRLL